MVRTVFAILLLALLAVGVWYGVRWYAERDDLHLTVVFESAGELRRGDPVTSGGMMIGRVTKLSRLESQDAVSILVWKDHRGELLRDSLFSVEESNGESRVEVVNTLAVGSPLPDGAVIYARDDKVSRWLARHGREVGEVLGKLEGKAKKLKDDYESGRLQEEFERYKQQVPEWKKQGEDVLRRNVEKVEEKVETMEKVLRENGRVKEADELRRRFEQWRAEAESPTPAPQVTP